MSQELYDRIAATANLYEMQPPVYARALLSKILLGERTEGFGSDWIIKDCNKVKEARTGGDNDLT